MRQSEHKAEPPDQSEENINDLSEDISQEWKLLGMEDWLVAALESSKTSKASGEASKETSLSYENLQDSPKNQPEEEPGAEEPSCCEAQVT